MTLIEITQITAEADGVSFICTCTVDHGHPEGIETGMLNIYRLDDPVPTEFTLQVKRWLKDHEGEYTIEPYTPPTAEELRGLMPPVTARQLRLTLVRNGYSLATITAAIDALPDGQEKDEALIEWEYATQFERLSPTLLTIAAALQISAEDIDSMWQQALAA